MPILLLDACALTDLARAENAINYEMPSSYADLSQPQLIEIFEKLTKSGCTVMLTRKVLTELFPTESGRLDFRRGADGKPEFPTGIGQEQLSYASTVTAYNTLAHFAHKGEVRCYDTINAMLDAKEVTQPRGGIVIVDTDSQKFQKAPVVDGMRLSPNRDYFDRVTRAKEIEKKRAIAAERHKDSGDSTLVKLGFALADHARQEGQDCSFMVATNDHGLAKRFVKMTRSGFSPVVCRSYELLWAMQKDHGQSGAGLDEGVAARYTNATEFVHSTQKRKMTYDADAFVRTVERAGRWFSDIRTEVPARFHIDDGYAARVRTSWSTDNRPGL